MQNIKQIELLAYENRRRIIDMIYQAGVGHVGGSLSIIDILTVIYEIDIDLNSRHRSKVILSKGHAVPAQYAILASKGIISETMFKTFRQINSKLQGHPYNVQIPEVDATTGLLGQGFSIAIGHALYKKYKNDDSHVYAIAGDGEMQEGEIWEALMCSSHHNLNNIIYIVDYNSLSSGGLTNEVINIDPLNERIKSFGINVIEVDGHNFTEIVDALQKCWEEENKPSCIIAHTIKGKGISFMENNPKWHSSGLTDNEYRIALEDLYKIKEGFNHEL